MAIQISDIEEHWSSVSRRGNIWACLPFKYFLVKILNISLHKYWIFPCKNIEYLLQKMQRICRGRCYATLRAITCINFSEVPSLEELRVFNRLRPSMSETLGSGMFQCERARWWAVCWPASDEIFALDQNGAKEVQNEEEYYTSYFMDDLFAMSWKSEYWIFHLFSHSIGLKRVKNLRSTSTFDLKKVSR